MKIQEEVEKQYKMLFPQETRSNKAQPRNARGAYNSSPNKNKEQPRPQSFHEKAKKIEPQDDKTYLKYKRHLFDDTRDMLLANQVKVEVKPDPKKKKKFLDVEKEKMQREIEELKQQMQAQKELFEVKQSLNELKEEMRRKQEEYKKSEVDDKKDRRSSSRGGSKTTNKDHSTPSKSPNPKIPTVA